MRAVCALRIRLAARFIASYKMHVAWMRILFKHFIAVFFHIAFISTALVFAHNSSAATAESAEKTPSQFFLGNAENGKILAEVERCQGCHSEEINDNPVIPKLSGQHAEYIFKQLNDFKSGARKHEIMSVMAADLPESNLADIAAYFSSIPIMHGEPIDASALAKNLFINGDVKRNILPCASCHGNSGKGQAANGVAYPAIGGQHRKYLRAQMVNWALGERTNSAGGVMNTIAKSLSERELEALCFYISGL
ncbi:MAG: cytochrome [Verrucomicrobiaceae bacterium]|nr:cytochrome [Verrucomicrobiaceae bacterium]